MYVKNRYDQPSHLPPKVKSNIKGVISCRTRLAVRTGTRALAGGTPDHAAALWWPGPRGRRREQRGHGLGGEDPGAGRRPDPQGLIGQIRQAEGVTVLYDTQDD